VHALRAFHRSGRWLKQQAHLTIGRTPARRPGTRAYYGQRGLVRSYPERSKKDPKWVPSLRCSTLCERNAAGGESDIYPPTIRRRDGVVPSGLPWAAIVLLVQGGHTPRSGRTEWRLLHLTEAGLSLALYCATRPLAHLRCDRVNPI
jgi:hypothetical protein